MDVTRDVPWSRVQPKRPTVGFSDALWALMIQMWQEEFESFDSPSVRPAITGIIERLRGAEEGWTLGRPVSRSNSSLSSQISMERRNCMSSVPPQNSLVCDLPNNYSNGLYRILCVFESSCGARAFIPL